MIVDEMRDRLAALSPEQLEVLDESEGHRGHSGWRDGGQTHFRIRMTSARFNDLNRLARHRLVHDTLGDIVPRIHALALELSGTDKG
ncbi:BolA family transcriptional regulator [Paracoccus sp. DMF-8]|uniref:BolA family protein n=1 Tax=Paracoccus sp. DMF-8 TaxID=3019445 RepID=UPI0023E8EA6A|nr:BolA family transcriptional regulator [Paracoccus sp. DMF-8]MDF3605975.1 BolA family transcriptional regulator [Paracoccus sp. DMF-8]